MKSYMKLAVMTAATVVCACQAAPDYAADGPTVTSSDFDVLVGKQWTGILTYIDYGSGKPTEIATAAQVSSPSPRGFTYTVSYPDEPWEDSKENVKISKDGRLLGGHEVIRRESLEEDGILIATRHAGEDDNRPATIRNTYRLGPDAFSIQKDVSFEGSENFQMRNVYAFTAADTASD